MSEWVPKIGAALFATIGHAAAFYQYRLQAGALGLPVRYGGQIIVLLVFSLLLSHLLFILRRESWQMGTLLAIGAVVILCVPFGGYTSFLLLMPLLLESGYYGGTWAGLAHGFVLTVLVLLLKNHDYLIGPIFMPRAAASEFIFMAVCAGALICFSAYLKRRMHEAAVCRELNLRFQETGLQLAAANLRLQDYAVVTEKETAQGERKRLARELHDTIAYTMTNLVVMLDAAVGLAVTDNENLVDHLSRIRAQAKEGLAEVRRVLQALRPTVLMDETGLPAIRRLVEMFAKATQIEVVLNYGNVPNNFGDEEDLVIYRLVQEGMTNALQHGWATHIEISISRIEHCLTVQIVDDGIGASGVMEGLGLMGMRERIERLGGRLEIISKGGGGFTLRAWIPIHLEG